MRRFCAVIIAGFLLVLPGVALSWDAGSWSGVRRLTGTTTLSMPGLGTTSTDGLVLENTTAAAAGAQQISPRTRWTGRGWETNTGSSQQTDYIAQLVPVQGAAAPQARLDFNYAINGGALQATPTMSLLNGDVVIKDTTSADGGIIFKGANRFIHNFHHPTGATAIPDGDNTFVGINAGNFTMGSTATIVNDGSYNVGIGVETLGVNTKGNSLTAVGYYALASNTEGTFNTAIGEAAQSAITIGNANVSVGANTLNVATIAENNTALGHGALYNLTTTSGNVAIGKAAGNVLNDGATTLQIPTNSIYIGHEARGFATNDNNAIVIGYQALGIGSNSVVLGNNSITTTALKGNVGVGTTEPSAKVHIVNPDTASDLKALWIQQNDAGNYAVDLSTLDYGVILRGPSGTGTILETTGTNTVLFGGNVGIAQTTFGTSAAKTLGMGAGTAPTTSLADMAHLWVGDVNAEAGKASLMMRSEITANGNGAVTGAFIKATTGSFAAGYEGMIEVNTFDNIARIFAEGLWRTIATW